MKCPKCGYVSFDYNQTCPKCNKDISTVQEKLNIPAFKPDPPSLLGALVGPRETDAHLNASGEIPVIQQETEISLGDPSAGPSDGAGLGDSQELDLSLELDADQAQGVEPPAVEQGEPEVTGLQTESGEIEGISLNESAVFPSPAPSGKKEEIKEESEEIPFDLEEIAIESGKSGGDAGGGADEKIEIELADLTLEDAEDDLKLEPVSPQEEQGVLDIGSLSLESQEEPGTEKKEEIALSLEDLQVNETGELEIGSSIHFKKGTGQAELVDDIELDLDTPPAAAEGGAKDEDVRLLLGDDTIEIPADAAEEGEKIDLDNLDIELDLDDSDHK
jgi:hypothetical protein